MRALGPDMVPDVVEAIDRRLADVAERHRVRIPWAIESGSRAWGFASPDSDYDCRFFFVRPAKAYADPWRPRDVIETPLDPVLDVNGWDVIKAVQLAVKGNATGAEWLRSPIVYGGDIAFRDEMLDLFGAVASPRAIARHYRHVGVSQLRSMGSLEEPAPLKRVSYALRPAAVLHWMTKTGRFVPPMELGELLREAPPANDVVQAIEELVRSKATTREVGNGAVPAPIRRFIRVQLDDDSLEISAPEGPSGPSARQDATVRFRALLARWAPLRERQSVAEPCGQLDVESASATPSERTS